MTTLGRRSTEDGRQKSRFMKNEVRSMVSFGRMGVPNMRQVLSPPCLCTAAMWTQTSSLQKPEARPEAVPGRIRERRLLLSDDVYDGIVAVSTVRTAHEEDEALLPAPGCRIFGNGTAVSNI